MSDISHQSPAMGKIWTCTLTQPKEKNLWINEKRTYGSVSPGQEFALIYVKKQQQKNNLAL